TPPTRSSPASAGSTTGATGARAPRWRWFRTNKYRGHHGCDIERYARRQARRYQALRFRHAVLGGDAAEKARDPVLQSGEEVSAFPAAREHLHRPTARYRMARGLRQGQGVLLHHRASRSAGVPGQEPYAIASVTLDEGVNVIANVINCKAEDLKVGMRVKTY